ncbi:hypothetical protein [Larkinella soli]|uniref:hypothetical protein n=1 Tax=Larkinella soli TaxID=1770527 RepID=UPI000FFBAD4C|nr:hypothetical protein [Larkinella soli]
MKKVLLPFALIGAFIACKNESTVQPDVTPASVVEVPYHKSARVTGTSLDVRIAAVDDSRCPINARCITAGFVTVTFGISDGSNNQDVKVELPASADKPVEKSFQLGGQTYEISLVEVSPEPEAGKPITLEDYKVRFSVEKL